VAGQGQPDRQRSMAVSGVGKAGSGLRMKIMSGAKDGDRSVSLGHLILPSTYSDEPRRLPNDSWYGLVREAEGTKSCLEKK